MIELISLSQAPRWDEIVCSFRDYDIYYMSGYVKAFMHHGDGEPLLVYVVKDGVRGICVYMKRDVASEKRLKNIPSGSYYDLITPYGYGGFIFEGDLCAGTLADIYRELSVYHREHAVVCEFVRWHPMLRNAEVSRNCIEVIDLGATIHMDLASKEVIWENIISKNRNKIRLAPKKGVRIEHSSDRRLFEEFRQIYNQTMARDNADAYYYFEPSFYDSISEDLSGNYELFYALLGEKIIAMSIILFANGRMHYHLSGSLAEYRNNNPTNLLLYEAACWGAEQGFATFHLGGGLGSAEDNLYTFKQAFNRQSKNRFSISRIIHDESVYRELSDNRAANDEGFDRESSFFPLYRS